MKMNLNKKGFTLVELLATIVILSLVMIITIPIGINAYNSSKIKGEKVFIEKINKLIDDYIALNYSKFTVNNNSVPITFTKCKTNITNEQSDCNNEYHARIININGQTEIPFKVLVDEGLMPENNFINPYDKESCYLNNENGNNYIEIFQDEDRVNYFRYKLECIKADENKGNDGYIYNTIPST